MKILSPVIVFFLLFFSLNTTKAQTVKGILTDESDNSPISGATVKLINRPDSLHPADSLTAYSTVSDKTGAFIFTNVIPKLYRLSVESVGLGKFQITVSVKDSMTTDLAKIPISKTSKILNEIVITASAPQVKQKADTLEYSASQFKVNPDANVEDLIKKMPGVTVDKAGTVTAQGETVKKVTVDGKDFFGDDATAALRNLPAEIIDKIQVFDKLSDQAAFTGFDDGNSQKSINVVTKTNMRNGQFGRMYAGYGTDNRYSVGGNVSFFKGNRRLSFVGLFNNINQQNFSSQDLLGVTSSSGGGGGRGGFGGQGGTRGGGGPAGGGNRGVGNFGGQQNFLVGQQNGINKTNAFGINYSNQLGKKLTLTGSYFFNNTNNSTYQITNRETKLSADSSIFYRDTSTASSTNYNNRVNLRLEYKIDSANSIFIIPSISFQKNTSQSVITAQQAYRNDFATGKLLNQSNSQYNAVTSGYNFNNTVLFRHSFAKKGRTISLGINTAINHKLGDSYTVSDTKYYKGVNFRDSTSNQFVDNLTNGYTVSANLAYTEPVGKKGQLQFNYNPSYTKNKADQQTFQFDPVGKNYSVFDTRLSNQFDNTYNTQNGGLTYRVGDRDNQFSAGASLQNSNLKSDQISPKTISVNKNFTNILPNLQLRRKLSAKSSLNIFFRTSVNAPSVTQLQNVENTSNALQYSTGNPDLKQQYTSSLVTRYTFTNTLKGQSFFANIFLQQANNYIANASYIAFSDSVLPSGLKVPAGVTLIKPVNLNGNWNIRSFFTYGSPIKFLKSNINLNAGVTYNKLPGITNYNKITTDNYTYNGGVVISSNISQYIDFNVSYNTSYNTIVQQPSNNYNTSTAGIQFNLLSKSGWFLQNDLNNQTYNYKSTAIPDQNFWLWNLSAGKKFLKDQKGELKLSVFDLLKQNKSITRTVAETYIEDVQSQVLQRYFMLTFTYKLKNFGTAAARAENNRQRGMQGGFPGGF